jgi:stearoyl-CoA desaturase (delta-9 desaturase)
MFDNTLKVEFLLDTINRDHPKWFGHTLALLGLCMLQGSPARWVATHWLHHKYSDEQRDHPLRPM